MALMKSCILRVKFEKYVHTLSTHMYISRYVVCMSVYPLSTYSMDGIFMYFSFGFCVHCFFLFLLLLNSIKTFCLSWSCHGLNNIVFRLIQYFSENISLSRAYVRTLYLVSLYCISGLTNLSQQKKRRKKKRFLVFIHFRKHSPLFIIYLIKLFLKFQEFLDPESNLHFRIFRQHYLPAVCLYTLSPALFSH